MRQKFLLSVLLLFVTLAGNSQSVNNQVSTYTPRWSTQQANAWYSQHKWITGANYIPANAINQLEMWQASTFSPAVIDKELGWAESIGFNTMRVFLHSVAWKQDATGFKKRMNDFLSIADKHHIQP